MWQKNLLQSCMLKIIKQIQPPRFYYAAVPEGVPLLGTVFRGILPKGMCLL